MGLETVIGAGACAGSGGLHRSADTGPDDLARRFAALAVQGPVAGGERRQLCRDGGGDRRLHPRQPRDETEHPG